MADGHIERVQTYVARSGRQLGNYGEEQLRSLYDRGHLLPTDNYWREGMDEWSTLGELMPAQPVAKVEPRPQPVEEETKAGWLILMLSVGGALLVGLVLLSFIVAHYHQKEASSRVAAEMARYAAQQREDQQQAPGTPVEPEQVSTEVQKLQDLSKAQSPADRSLTDETVALIQDISKRGQACRDAEKDMLDLGFSPVKLTSMAEIDKRRDAIQAALPTLQAMVAYIGDINTKIRADLKEKGVTTTAADAFIAGMQQSGKTDSLLTYWKQELSISNDLLANLELLKRHYGEWHIEADKVMFNDDAILTLFQANIDKLKADIATQQTVQANLQKAEQPPQ